MTKVVDVKRQSSISFSVVIHMKGVTGDIYGSILRPASETMSGPSSPHFRAYQVGCPFHAEVTSRLVALLLLHHLFVLLANSRYRSPLYHQRRLLIMKKQSL